MEYSEMLINRIKDLCRQRGGITIHRLAKMSSLRQSTLDNIIRGSACQYIAPHRLGFQHDAD